MTTSQPDRFRQDPRAINMLTMPGLIRLVTEIDDNGPISTQWGSVRGAFGDLSPWHLQVATRTARDLGLVYGDEEASERYALTAQGEDLAEVYDTAARWARAHQFPSAACDFVTRVQRTLRWQAGSPETRGATGVPAEPHLLLVRWLKANPEALHYDPRAGQEVDEVGRAA